MSEENHEKSLSSESGVASQTLAVVDQLAPKGWRLKLAKATSQLLVGTRAGAAVYAEAREHLDEIEGRSAMNKALYAVAAQQVINDPEMVERAKARLVGGMLTKQENLEAVIEGATDRVLDLPAETNDFSNSDSHGDSKGDSTPPEQPLNSDWAAAFTEAAENATSDELRDRLSRVLAGEIASKGTFPRSTIRTIADLEQADIKAFIAVLPFTYGQSIILDDSISKEILELLNDAGLIDYNPTIGHSIIYSIKPGAPGGFPGKEWAFITTVSAEKIYNLPAASLTRTGKAVLTLLDDFDEEKSLRKIADKLEKENVDQIILGKFIKVSDENILISNGEIIFPRK